MGVLPLQVLEGVEVPGGREAGLGAGDVEADDALVAVARRRARRSRCAGGVPHRGEQGADPDPVAAAAAAASPSREALGDRLDDLVELQARVRCCSGAYRTSA